MRVGVRVLCGVVVLVGSSACGAAPPPRSPAGDPARPAPAAVAPVPDVSAADVVDDPGSRLVDVAVAPGDPAVRAATWRRCADVDCASYRVALAVSTDGFRTRVLPSRTWRATPVVRVDDEGRAVVVVWEKRLELAVVSPSGAVADVRRTRHVAPVAPGEIVAGVDHGRGGTSFLATDPVRAVAHVVRVPRDSVQLAQLPSGQLRATTLRRTYAWSSDGGATWQESAGASATTLLQSMATSGPDDHVLVGGSDGATLFPFEEVRTLESWDSWSVVPQVDEPRAYVGATAVLPDGRFLADVEDWSDEPPPGLYVSDGRDWAAYTRLELGEPFGEPRFGVPDVRYVAVDGRATTLGAIGPDGRSWFTSIDLGASWDEAPVR